MDISLMIESIPRLLEGAVVTLQLLLLTEIIGFVLALPLGILYANGSGPCGRRSPASSISFAARRCWSRSSSSITASRSSSSCARAALAVSAQALHLRAAGLCPAFRRLYREYPARRDPGRAGRRDRGGARLRHVGLPGPAADRAADCVRLMLPAYSNQAIGMLKGTSLASTITLMELTGVANTIVGRYVLAL